MFDVNRRRGASFIVVTHNDRLARRMPRLLRLVAGKLENLT
jgi:predicted ABC-type transport system involved in lysophospholipase L1 biosynthesis ATPase subunit